MSVPTFIFIVPYRDRLEHLTFFMKHMKYILEDLDSNKYQICIVHQCDSRSFNRGAMKNIGFLAMKSKYPNDYKNITYVFNDVDTMPFTKNLLQYETTEGIVKHFYGFTFALGGIVSILGKDFEKINGFPNYWGWGYEDNLLQKRVLMSGMTIDRSHYYPILDQHILQFNHGVHRNVNRKDFQLYSHSDPEGLNEISQLSYTEDDLYIQVATFHTGRDENTNLTKNFDLTTGSQPFSNGRLTPQLNMVISHTPMSIHPETQNISQTGHTKPIFKKLMFFN